MERIVGTWFLVVTLVLMVLGSGPAGALELVKVDDGRERTSALICGGLPTPTLN